MFFFFKQSPKRMDLRVRYVQGPFAECGVLLMNGILKGLAEQLAEQVECCVGRGSCRNTCESHLGWASLLVILGTLLSLVSLDQTASITFGPRFLLLLVLPVYESHWLLWCLLFIL